MASSNKGRPAPAHVNPCRGKVFLLKAIPDDEEVPTTHERFLKVLEPNTADVSATDLQAELVARNARLLEENTKIRLDIALLEKDNKSITGRVDLYDNKINEANAKIKELLLKQNQQFFELNQRLGERLGEELKCVKGVDSSIRLRSENGYGSSSHLEFVRHR
jgi:hypothetical protein